MLQTIGTMKTILSNIALAIGIFIAIMGGLFKILHYSFWGLTGNHVFYIGISISAIALILNIFFTKNPQKKIHK